MINLTIDVRKPGRKDPVSNDISDRDKYHDSWSGFSLRVSVTSHS